jgi:predicted transcriptional regulator
MLGIAVQKKPGTQKTEALSIRIDPRLRFGLELVARNQRRSVTGVVEWAIESYLNEQQIDRLNQHSQTFADVTRQAWSDNEVERLANLGTQFPELMTYEESRMWRVISQTTILWNDRQKLRMDADIVLHQWAKLRPLLVEAAAQEVLLPLSNEQLTAAGIDFNDIPF